MKMKEVKNIISVMLAAALLIGLVSCKNADSSKDKDKNLILSIFYLDQMSSGSLFEFRKNDSYASSVAMQNTGYQTREAGAAPIKNMEGLTQAQYGDGDEGQNYTDRFLSPIEVTVSTRMIVGYLPESGGGPARGKETADNGEILVNAKDYGFDSYFSILGYNAASNYDEFSKVINKKGGISKYDRLGFLMTEIRYSFDDKVTAERFRWINIEGKNIFNSLSIADSDRFVYATQRYGNIYYSTMKQCYDLYANAGFFYLLNRTFSKNSLAIEDGTSIDQSYNFSGTEMPLIYSNENNPLLSGENYSGGDYPALTVQSLNPDGTARTENDFLVIADVPQTGTQINKIIVNVDTKNVLFWDSDVTGDTKFDATRDAPGTKPGKDFKVHLPIFGITVE
jgi:hypothetical protein